jgi:hypothetical protein
VADEFRKIRCTAVAHQPQPRFGIERDARHLTVLEAQTDDQIRLTVVTGAELRGDDDRAA